MDNEDNDYITKLISRYGVYKVLLAILRICRLKCKTEYAYNPEAVIHKDTHLLGVVMKVAASFSVLREPPDDDGD